MTFAEIHVAEIHVAEVHVVVSTGAGRVLVGLVSSISSLCVGVESVSGGPGLVGLVTSMPGRAPHDERASRCDGADGRRAEIELT